MRPFYKNSDGLITFRGRSRCGDDGPKDWKMFIDQGKTSAVIGKDPFSPSDLSSSNLKHYQLKFLPGDSCRAGMPLWISQEGGKSQLWGTGWLIQGHQQLSGQAWGPPCWQPCPSVLRIFKSSKVPSSRSSIPLPSSVGSTLRDRKQKGKCSNFIGEKSHKCHFQGSERQGWHHQ